MDRINNYKKTYKVVAINVDLAIWDKITEIGNKEGRRKKWLVEKGLVKVLKEFGYDMSEYDDKYE